MNPEILRFGRINAAPNAKATIRIPLERNLSFMYYSREKSDVFPRENQR
jgi:hypothetical protein